MAQQRLLQWTPEWHSNVHYSKRPNGTAAFMTVLGMYKKWLCSYLVYRRSDLSETGGCRVLAAGVQLHQPKGGRQGRNGLHHKGNLKHLFYK